MKKSKTKAQLAADAAFIAKIASITFGTGAKSKSDSQLPFNESHPAWPKCPHGSPMKLESAGLLIPIPFPAASSSSNAAANDDDLSFSE